jgi:hypothetical protein
MFVIMFKHHYRPIGPFDSQEAAEQYGKRAIELEPLEPGNEWKVRRLDPPTLIMGALIRERRSKFTVIENKHIS